MNGTAPSSRVPLVEEDNLPEDYQHLLTEDTLGSVPNWINVFKALANSPPAMQANIEYTRTLYDELSPCDRELVILTVARTLTSEYEWQQHVQSAQKEGIPREDIRALGANELTSFSDREQVLIEYAQATVLNEVADESYRALAEYYEDDEVVVITLLAGAYHMMVDFFDALAIPLENEFVGWTPGDGET